MRSRTRAEPLDAISQFADLPLQPFERRGAQGGRGEEIAHFFRLLSDAFIRLRLDCRRREAVDLAADRADLALEPGGRGLRVMRLHHRVEFRGHRLERREHRFAVAALTQHLNPLHEIANRALERDHRVARRKIGEALAHGVDLGAHGAEVDGGGARFGSLAPHVVELAAKGSNVVEQQLRERSAAWAGIAKGSMRADFGSYATGVHLARIVIGLGRRERLGVVVHPRVRRRAAGLAAAGAGLELVATHGDLRHRGLEIEWRLRVRRGRLSEAVAPRLAGLSGAGQVRPDQFEPSHHVDQRAAVAVPRRVVALQDLSNKFKGARGLCFGARKPHLKALDHRTKRVRDSGRARLFCRRISPRDALEASGSRVEPIVQSFVVVRPRMRVQSRVVGDRFVKPIVKAQAGAAGGLHGGVAAPPAHARDIPRHGSIHVLDHRSGAANRPGIRGDVALQFCRGSW